VIHFLTFVVCILSVEIFVRSNFSHYTLLLLQVTRKVIKVLPQKNISDHWKERAIPAYAFKMMQYSFRMLLILLSILFLFFIANYIFDGFIDFSVSPRGIAETLVFAFGYVILRKFFLQ